MAKLRRHLTIFTLLAVSVCLHAQTAPRSVELEFTVFAQNRLSGLFFVPAPGAKPEELKFYSQARSASYSYRGANLFSVYSGSPSSVNGQAPSAPVAARLQIPEGMTRALLFFVENPNKSDGTTPPYIILPLNDTLDQVPRGHVRIVNLAGLTYAADIGGERLILERGLSRPIRIDKSATIRLAVQLREQWVPAGSRDVAFRDNIRGFLVFFPPLEKGGIAPNIRELLTEVPSEQAATSRDR